MLFPLSRPPRSPLLLLLRGVLITGRGSKLFACAMETSFTRQMDESAYTVLVLARDWDGHVGMSMGMRYRLGQATRTGRDFGPSSRRPAAFGLRILSFRGLYIVANGEFHQPPVADPGVTALVERFPSAEQVCSARYPRMVRRSVKEIAAK